MQEETTVLETTEKLSETGEDKKQGWIRIHEEKHFGSVTGSDFRVWGDE